MVAVSIACLVLRWRLAAGHALRQPRTLASPSRHEGARLRSCCARTCDACRGAVMLLLAALCLWWSRCCRGRSCSGGGGGGGGA